MADPLPPHNVRAVMADGREIPLECRYDGLRDGQHQWAAVLRLAEPPLAIRIGVLPGHTSVVLEWVNQP